MCFPVRRVLWLRYRRDQPWRRQWSRAVWNGHYTGFVTRQGMMIPRPWPQCPRLGSWDTALLQHLWPWGSPNPLSPTLCSHFALPWAAFCWGAELLFPSQPHLWLFLSQAHLSRQWLFPSQAAQAKQALSCREVAHGTLAAQNTPRRFSLHLLHCVLTRTGLCPSLLGCVYLGPLQKQRISNKIAKNPFLLHAVASRQKSDGRRRRRPMWGQVVCAKCFLSKQRGCSNGEAEGPSLVMVVVLHRLGCSLPFGLVFIYFKTIPLNEKCILVCLVFNFFSFSRDLNAFLQIPFLYSHLI